MSFYSLNAWLLVVSILLRKFLRFSKNQWARQKKIQLRNRQKKKKKVCQGSKKKEKLLLFSFILRGARITFSEIIYIKREKERKRKEGEKWTST
jgi:hypothetical protein